MKFHRKVVILTWPEGLGEQWLNMANLKLLLHSPKHSRPSVLEVEDITEDITKMYKAANDLADEVLEATEPFKGIIEILKKAKVIGNEES